MGAGSLAGGPSAGLNLGRVRWTGGGSLAGRPHYSNLELAKSASIYFQAHACTRPVSCSSLQP